MTRQKKSRKPGVGSSGASKKDKTLLEAVSDKKPKKKSGKPAGNRQQEALNKKKTHSGANAPKDPRVGSKKPIDLGAPVKVEMKTNKQTQSKKPSVARVRVIEQGPTIAQQLAAIENDERLQLILAKQEDEEPLSEEEVSYYNEQMEQYETLSAQLPADEDAEQASKVDDDDLWDKLDTSNFSDYE